MRRPALLLLLLAAAARGEESDPEGTVALDLKVGQTAPVTAEPGASVLCDDLHVAAGEFSADGNGFLIRALRPGSTLCGIWLAGQKPGGLYRVRVTREAAADAGAAAQPPRPPDAGPADAGR